MRRFADTLSRASVLLAARPIRLNAMPDSVLVTVPGTTSNLGPGFDCLGAALTLHNHFRFTRGGSGTAEVTIEVTGAEASRVACDSSNLAYQAFAKLFQQIGKPVPPLHLAIALEVPLARGLGSSATAIVAGLVGANALAGSPLSQEEVMAIAIGIEGHPDNVVPALLGGCRLAAADQGKWTICDVPCHPDVALVLGIPDFEVSTAEARRVLPSEYSRADAIFNMAHLGLLLRGLETGDPEWLRMALKDRIHQPYRKSLMQGFEAVQAAAMAAGAYGVVVSGAGPTLLAIAHPDQTQKIAQVMATTWAKLSIQSIVKVLNIDPVGTRVEGGD